MKCFTTFSKVPAIAYGGPVVPANQPSPESTKLVESLILNEFIGDLFPASSLLPSSPVERAKARFFIDTFSNQFSPPYISFLLRGDSKEALFAALKAQQDLLVQNGNKKFAVNDDFTIADAAVLPFFARFETVLSNDLGAYEEGEGKQVLNTLATEPKYKIFWDYFQRLKSRESFKKTYWPVSLRSILPITKSSERWRTGGGVGGDETHTGAIARSKTEVEGLKVYQGKSRYDVCVQNVDGVQCIFFGDTFVR